MKTVSCERAAQAFGIKYLDECNRPAVLTEAEQEFFLETVATVLRATGVSVAVVTADHEALPGDRANALGIHWAATDGSHEFITLDCYFIHERYGVERCGQYAIEPQSLADVLCHELAHMRYQRHTKYHAALTAHYIGLVAGEVAA